MDELIARLRTRVGLSAPQAETAVVVLLAFLDKEAPPAALAELFTALPDARRMLEGTAITEAADAEDTQYLGGMSRLMRVADRLMATGLDMTQVQTTVREVVAFARERAGDGTVDEIVTGIPGLRHAL
ncbi:DUF2267 domain-containing protein [Azorhizobium oxalatiphilum]|nr:DUF2267 domain-containing protein [Azorhizobium oxalatiphilum]